MEREQCNATLSIKKRRQSAKITTQDEALIDALRTWRVISGNDLIGTFFKDRTAMNRRMRELVYWRFINGWRPQTLGHGSIPYVYWPRRTPLPSRWQHHSGLYAVMTRALYVDHDISWARERSATIKISQNTLIPDLTIGLRSKQIVIIEFDCNTEPISNVVHKQAAYEQWLKSSAWQAIAQTRPIVLWVTDDRFMHATNRLKSVVPSATLSDFTRTLQHIAERARWNNHNSG